MTRNAKLFPITDVVYALTGVAVSRDKTIPVRLYRHLEGTVRDKQGPTHDFSALRLALKAQLPPKLADFSLHSLALLVIDVKQHFQQADLQDALVMYLENQFGKMVAICPNDEFGLDSNSLRMLRAIAEAPEQHDPSTLPDTSVIELASKPTSTEGSEKSSIDPP